jgi:predicted nucleotidyltransferase
MNTAIINKIKEQLPKYPIEKAWIFGSYARREETKNSDVDILVRFDKDTKISLFGYIEIMLGLEKKLHKKVDMAEEGQVRNFAQQFVEHDKILIYERVN